MSSGGATLVQLTDTHLPAGSALLHGKIDTWARTSAALEAAARFSPDAVLVTGDVSERGAPIHERAARLFAQAERELGCQVITVPGNHDPAGAVGAAFNPRRLASGPYPADTVHVIAGLRVIGLDTHVFREAGGRLETRQLAWLRVVLATPAAGGSVLAMHHPPIDSLLPELAGRGLSRPGDLAAALAGSDVRGILCGHYHLPCSGNLGGIPVGVSPAVSYNHGFFTAEGSKPGMDPIWFSVIKVGAGQLSAKLVQVPVPAVEPTRHVPVPARQAALLS